MTQTKTAKWNLTAQQARAVYWLKNHPEHIMLLKSKDLDFALKHKDEFRRAGTFSAFIELNLIEIVGEDDL
ncbi:TPA: hypothetical protein ENX78_08525 [Candidatus Poribacteria bacterium]|nr:hypothetical protein [Candidatus Poribacteria bacterium]